MSDFKVLSSNSLYVLSRQSICTRNSLDLDDDTKFYELEVVPDSRCFDLFHTMICFCKCSSDPAEYLLNGQVEEEICGSLGWRIDDTGNGYWYADGEDYIYVDVRHRRLFSTTKDLTEDWHQGPGSYFLAF